MPSALPQVVAPSISQILAADQPARTIQDLMDFRAEQAQILSDARSDFERLSRQDVVTPDITVEQERLRNIGFELDRLNDQFENGLISSQQYANGLAMTNQRLSELDTNLVLTDRQIQTLSQGMADFAGRAVSDFDSVGEAARNLAGTLIRTLGQDLLENLLGGQGFGASLLGRGVGFLFGGGRQFGGPVQRGVAYEVGEAGREFFVPGSNGIVVPETQQGLSFPFAPVINSGNRADVLSALHEFYPLYEQRISSQINRNYSRPSTSRAQTSRRR